MQIHFSHIQVKFIELDLCLNVAMSGKKRISLRTQHSDSRSMEMVDFNFGLLQLTSFKASERNIDIVILIGLL